MFTEIRCLECVEIIDAENIDLDTKWAKCGNCANAFGIEHKWNSRLRKKRETFQPEGFDLVKTDSLLEIAIDPLITFPDSKIVKIVSKFPWLVVKLASLFFSLFLSSFLFTVIKDQMDGTNEMADWIGLSIVLTLTITSWAISIWLIFFRKEPKHILTVSKKSLQFRAAKVQHEELLEQKDMPKNIDLHTSDINQIYVRSDQERNLSFQVVVVKGSAEIVLPLGIISELHYALYLEQEIERFLNIRDERVDKEYNA